MIRLALVCFVLVAPFTIHAQRISRSGYVEAYKDVAITEMKRSGVPASITLAQGILESDCGNSALAKKSNNHFGIKCHDWTGDKAYHDDDRKGECFRKYKSAGESFVDHSDFLTGRSRYSELFELKTTDYKGWAHGLKKAGYATDPHYARLLIKIIEEDELWRHDREISASSRSSSKTSSSASTKKPTRRNDDFVISPFNVHKIEYNNGVRYINVKEGDSFESISQEFGLQSWELYHYNDLDKNASLSESNQIYLQRKKNKAYRSHPQHTVKEGETLWSISHKYGVKLKKLRYYNHLGRDQEVNPGEVINLRKKKP